MAGRIPPLGPRRAPRPTPAGRRLAILAVVSLAVVSLLDGTAVAAPPAPDDALATLLRHSLHDRGGRTVDSILQQDAVQRFCSAPPTTQITPTEQTRAEAQALQQDQLAQVHFPADGRYLGDWRAGEKVAQSGRGLQFSDAPETPAGGNCYACHQLSASETAYGNLGPSLLGYGRLHGAGPEVLRATWIRLYNSQAVHLCSVMPRFGQQGILSETQLQDLMALLLAPDSPVNRAPSR